METVKRVGLDTNIFMGVFLEEADKLEASVRILTMTAEGTLEGVVSSISLVEIATLFGQKGETIKAREAVSLIRNRPNITIVDVTADMAMDIAETKVNEKLSIADAAVLTSATIMHSDAFLTYDSDFAGVKKIRCMTPQEYLKTQ